MQEGPQKESEEAEERHGGEPGTLGSWNGGFMEIVKTSVLDSFLIVCRCSWFKYIVISSFMLDIKLYDTV